MCLTKLPMFLYFVLVISGIFLFTFRDMGYLGKLIMGIFLHLLKGIWDTCLFTSRDMGYRQPPYTSLSGRLAPFLLRMKQAYRISQMNSKYAGRRQEHTPLFLQETALQEPHRPSRRNLMTGELPGQWECLKELYIGSI